MLIQFGCIGQKYGILEIKIVLANLMRQFRFAVADASQPMLTPSSEVVLKPKHGVSLIVSKRTTVDADGVNQSRSNY